MTIAPDNKDWTWVLERPCPECGFDAGAITGPEVPAALRANSEDWRAVLVGEGEPGDLRRRPSPQCWSTLEYACHVRDVLRIAFGRVSLLLAEDLPTFANWDQDATAVEDRYDIEDSALVAVALTAAASQLAVCLDNLELQQWSRVGKRSDGAAFSVDTFSRYVLHDVVHHIYDVRRGDPLPGGRRS